MAKPITLHGQIAAHFTNAYRTPDNNDVIAPLTGLYELLDEEGREKRNVEKGLRQSLDIFIAFCKQAAQDINDGNVKTENLVKASEEMKRVNEGFDLLKKSYPDVYKRYEDSWEEVRDQSKTLSAAAWIKEAQEDYKAGRLSLEEASIRILAARNLANAQRGVRHNIDHKLLTKAELDRLAEFLNTEDEYREFFTDNEKAAALIDEGHGGKLEEMFRAHIHSIRESNEWSNDLFGRYKMTPEEYESYWEIADAKERSKQPSATEYIEKVQKKVDTTNLTDAGYVNAAEEILAVRRLANAQQNKRKNIDKTHLFKDEIHEAKMEFSHNGQVVSDFIDALKKEARDAARAKRKAFLMEEYYLTENSPDLKNELDRIQGKIDDRLFTAGHGGKLEEKFAAYLKTREDYKDLNRDVFGRYMDPEDRKPEIKEPAAKEQKIPEELVQAQPAVKPMQPEYENYNDFFEKNKNNADRTISKFYHAAKMAAAHDLRRDDLNNFFDRKELVNKAKAYMKNPAFRLITRDPAKLDKICGGDVQELAMNVNHLNTEFSNINGATTEFDNAQFWLGTRDDVAGVQNVLDAAEKFTNAPDGNKTLAAIGVVDAIIEFQDAHKDAKKGPEADAVNASMKMLGEFVDGTDAEHYFTEQMRKVNEARGLAPNAPDFLSKESVLGGDEDVPEMEVSEFDRNLFDQIKNFTFLKQDDKDSMEEMNKEINNEKEKAPSING